LNDLDPKIYLADQQYKFTKASFDAVRYQYEDALANTPKTAPKSRSRSMRSSRSSVSARCTWRT
jgi:hypothetical protein